jgi:hypothetical protein
MLVSPRQRSKVEADFEDLLGEYSDGEIGELEEPAEGEATRGHIEVRPWWWWGW